MASTAINLQTGSLDERREGISVLTKEQQVNTSILRMRSNASDLLVFMGKVVNDNFFDENLLDSDVAGSITSSPNNYAEKRTLGQGEAYESPFTEVSDFNPVSYISDEGLAIYPLILTALGYADPVAEDSIIGVFESRPEVVNLRFTPAFAKKGPKASLCSAAEGIDRLSYPIKQMSPRSNSSDLAKRGRYVEASSDESLVKEMTYQDQDPAGILPFTDDYDESFTFKVEVLKFKDDEIVNVLLSASTNCVISNRDEVTSAAGWTFLNKVNGTDSIVYSDRS